MNFGDSARLTGLHASYTYKYLADPNVHDRVHKSPPMNPIVKQLRPVNTLTSYLFKMHSIFSPAPRSPKFPIRFKFSD
jgi:hypothetical protein